MRGMANATAGQRTPRAKTGAAPRDNMKNTPRATENMKIRAPPTENTKIGSQPVKPRSAAPFFPYPKWLLADLDAAGKGKPPFEAAKVSHNVPGTVEDIRVALQTGDFKWAIRVLYHLAGENRLREIPDAELASLVPIIKRARLGNLSTLGSLIFHELLVVRSTRLNLSTLTAGLELFAEHSPPSALYLLSLYQKSGGLFGVNALCWTATSYIHANQLDKAGKLLTHALQNLERAKTEHKLLRAPFIELIRRSPLPAALEWHALALSHYGFPASPISSPASSAPPPSEFDESLGILNASLARCLAQNGREEDCLFLLDAQEGYKHPRNPRILSDLRTSVIRVNLRNGKLELAEYLYSAWAKDETGIRVSAFRSLLDSLAGSDKQKAIELFERDIEKWKGDNASDAYLTAIRIAHPDVKRVEGLLQRMEAGKLRIPFEARVWRASALLASPGNLGKRAEKRRPELRVNELLAALALPGNLGQLPRVYGELLQPLLESSPAILAEGLQPDSKFDYEAALRSAADEKIGEKTSAEWTALLSELRSKAIEAAKNRPSDRKKDGKRPGARVAQEKPTPDQIARIKERVRMDILRKNEAGVASGAGIEAVVEVTGTEKAEKKGKKTRRGKKGRKVEGAGMEQVKDAGADRVVGDKKVEVAAKDTEPKPVVDVEIGTRIVPEAATVGKAEDKPVEKAEAMVEKAEAVVKATPAKAEKVEATTSS